jgi:RHS repeat-associated protein
MSALRLLVACLVSCVAVVVGAPAGALADLPHGAAGTGALSFNPLVIPGMQPLVGAQQVQADEDALRDSPEVYEARLASRTAFESLNAEAAQRVADEAFPRVIGRPSGVLGSLPSGQQVVGFPTDHAAQVDLADGKHAVIESFEPLALQGSNGGREPMDLGLEEKGGVFQPVRSDVSVRIPSRLAQGVQLPDLGLSLTPVDAQGTALGGSSGVDDGATVLYANTQIDSDTVVKPLAVGFEEDTLLRSVASPGVLRFRVGMPGGARLKSVKGGSGAVRIADEGATIATISAPSAVDAAGTAVPVSVSLSGDILSISVDRSDDEYRYPIMVDPTVADSHLLENWEGYSNWKVETNGPFAFTEDFEGIEGISDHDHGAEYKREQWGGIAYETQGESHIYGFISETSASNPGSNIENKLYITSPGHGVEKSEVMSPTYSKTRKELCVESGCAIGKVTKENEKNAAEFKQTATNTGTEFTSTLQNASVQIVQEKAPTVSFDVTERTLPDGFLNAAYPGNWDGPRALFMVTAKDPGLGVYAGVFTSSAKAGWNSEWNLQWSACKSIQCLSSSTQYGSARGWDEGYESQLPDGEDTVEAKAEDAAKLTGSAIAKIKVDYSSPYNLTLTGLPANKELGGGSYTLKATAKDGTTVESSGVESIKLKLDGQEVGKASGSCTPGPCVATGEWTLNASEIPAGQHKLTVTATDYAGNVSAPLEYIVDTGHVATPIALGPGAVSPETGEFFLNASDVSVGGPGAGLTVNRSYNSYHLTAGAESPMGPQWAMSVGGSQTLTKAAEGAVVLTGSEGEQSLFTSKGKGEFNSPANSASLKLSEVVEHEATKEFLLTTATGTVTKFTLPSGGMGSTWVPSTLEGPGATNIETYSFKTVSGITEPTEVLGPVPAGVSCSSGLVKGCRALGFVYDTKTTAKGDGASEWGEYEGRLKEVTFTAWEPVSAKMQTTSVADYVYDKEGKLRGEWDPQITPTLETTYGYDAAGHVTAITPPGQQPWLLVYGSAPTDPRPRLLSATRPSPSTAAGSGVAPVNTAIPVLSTLKGRVGIPVSVTTGTWNNTPLTYSYQWEGCSGGECHPILGATSQTYTPTESPGPELAVTVTAANSDGAVSASTGIQEFLAVPGASFKKKREFGFEGTGNGQVKEPAGIAVESASTSEGDVWVSDTGNNRIEKFTSSGTFVAAYGTKGKGNGEFEKPTAIALDPTDTYVYVVDTGNKRIQVFEAKTGKYLTQVSLSITGSVSPELATGKLSFLGVEKTYLFVTSPGGNDIVYYRISGKELIEPTPFGSNGTGNGQFKEPTGIAVSEKGRGGTGNQIFVTDTGNHRVEVLDAAINKIEYVTQFGSSGSGEGEFGSPINLGIEPESGVVAGVSGDVFVADSGNNRVQQSSQTGENPFDWNFGSGRQSLAIDSKSGEAMGEILVASAAASAGSDRLAGWMPEAATITAPAPPNPGLSSVWTIEYDVPVSGSTAPAPMGKTEVETWGQKDLPTEATAIFPPSKPMGWPARNYSEATIYYLDGNAHTVNIMKPNGGVSTTEYNSKGEVERTLSPDNRAVALGDGSKSAEESKLIDSETTYNAEGTEIDSTLGPLHKVELPNGTQVEARAHKVYSYDEGAPTEGGPYGLPTKITEGAQFSGKEEDIRETITSYSGQSNLGWKLHKPTSVTTDPKGLKLVHTVVYEAATGAVKETVMPAGKPSERTAHGTETIYYSVAKNTSVPACGEHAEWANLPCGTQPAKQPETAGVPNLPVTVTTYNMWDEPVKTVETVGTTTRTKTVAYDAAGRPKESSVSSSVGTTLPTVVDEYDASKGALEKQKTTEGSKTETVTSVYNSVGELTSYTDADGNTSGYAYDVDGRVVELNDGKGTQTYVYRPNGLLETVRDSAAGEFSATYDAEGNILDEFYPNGMTAKYSYDPTGKATTLEYVKARYCGTSCTWFSDTVVPSIHGQWLSQVSSLSSQAYKYDAAGRLTQVQNTPAGGGCTTREYAYDEDTNRTSLTTFSPGGKGECTSTGGSVEKHTYDSADRLLDSGIAYSTFGNITALPAADAGGYELTSSYYADNQLASQTQNGQTVGYSLDPEERTRETVSTGKSTSDVVSHYAGPGNSPAWTVNTAGEWKRNVTGINGELAAIQNNGEAPVLQLTNLHGDIIATAATSETVEKLASTADTTEFGVPATSAPAKYFWLGGIDLATELPSGVIAMGARSYVPQLGRFLQTDPVPGGSANAYSYTFGDPVNTTDPSGEFTEGFSGWLKEQNNQEAQEVAAREAARELLEREEAERRAREAAEAAAAAGPQAQGEEPLGGYAGWACEYALETGQEAIGCSGGGGLDSIVYSAFKRQATCPEPAPKDPHHATANSGTPQQEYDRHHEPSNPEEYWESVGQALDEWGAGGEL